MREREREEKTRLVLGRGQCSARETIDRRTRPSHGHQRTKRARYQAHTVRRRTPSRHTPIEVRHTIIGFRRHYVCSSCPRPSPRATTMAMLLDAVPAKPTCLARRSIIISTTRVQATSLRLSCIKCSARYLQADEEAATSIQSAEGGHYYGALTCVLNQELALISSRHRRRSNDYRDCSHSQSRS